MNAHERQLAVLAALVELEREARHAESARALGFIMVNETRHVLDYRQAVFWRLKAAGGATVEAVSGVSAIDGNAPFIRWAQDLARAVARQEETGGIRVPDRKDMPESLGEGWREWGGEVLFCPLSPPGGALAGGLFFIRDAAWQEPEKALAARLVDAYAHAWRALRPEPVPAIRRLRALWEQRRTRIGMAVFAFMLLWLPVRISALAPASVVPVDPVVVAAPMAGVVEAVHVSPNQAVRKGQLLFSLDDTSIRNRRDIALKALAVARADFMRASQMAFANARSKANVALLKAKLEEREAELQYTNALLKRKDVRAPVAGIAVFEDANDWRGRPVAVGERVLTIADSARAEAELLLPVADAINLAPGAEVRLFLDVDPTHPLAARLRQTSYEARPTPDGILAFRLKASFMEGEAPPRIGLHGAAKIYGDRVSLIYYVMRRPLAALRQWLGL